MMALFVSDFDDAQEVMRATAVFRQQVLMDQSIRERLEKSVSKPNLKDAGDALTKWYELMQPTKINLEELI